MNWSNLNLRVHFKETVFLREKYENLNFSGLALFFCGHISNSPYILSIKYLQEISCYLDHLLSENTLTEEQLITLIWEAIIEASDTTLITTEWAMYELTKNPECQVTGEAHTFPFFF